MEETTTETTHSVDDAASDDAKIDPMYTVSQVAPQVHMSEQGLYAACREKQFPHVRIGSRIRIPASALARWVEEQVSGGATNNALAGER